MQILIKKNRKINQLCNFSAIIAYREEDAEKARAEAEEAYAMQMSVSSVAANYATEILQVNNNEISKKFFTILYF